MANEYIKRAMDLNKDIHDKKFKPEERKALKTYLEKEYINFNNGIVYEILSDGKIPTVEQASSVMQNLQDLCRNEIFYEKWMHCRNKSIKKNVKPVSKQVEKLHEFMNKPRKR